MEAAKAAAPRQILAPQGSYPVDENGEFVLPSVGSAGHLTRTCRPCHYIHTKAGCTNGYACGFCHCKHSKRSRPRLPKAQRIQCRSLAQTVFDAQRGTEEQRRIAEAQLLVQTSSDPRLAAYATSVLRSLRGGAVLHGVGSRSLPAAMSPEENVFAEELGRLLQARDGGQEYDVSDDDGPWDDEAEEPARQQGGQHASKMMSL